MANASCETTSKMNRVALGMTKREVVSSIGSPSSTSSPGQGVEILHYHLNPRSGPIVNLIRDDYIIKIVNGKVVSYGKADDLDGSDARR